MNPHCSPSRSLSTLNYLRVSGYSLGYQQVPSLVNKIIFKNPSSFVGSYYCGSIIKYTETF